MRPQRSSDQPAAGTSGGRPSRGRCCPKGPVCASNSKPLTFPRLLYDYGLLYLQFDASKIVAAEIDQPMAAALVRLPWARRSSQ